MAVIRTLAVIHTRRHLGATINPVLALDAPTMDRMAQAPPPEPDAAERRAQAIGSTSLTLVGFGGALIGAKLFSIHAPACPFLTVTGVPCPGCGMTRLANAVAHGNVGAAVVADAAGVALLGVLAVLALVHLHGLATKKAHPPAWMRSWVLPVGIVALVAAHWVTNIITGLPTTL